MAILFRILLKYKNIISFICGRHFDYCKIFKRNKKVNIIISKFSENVLEKYQRYCKCRVTKYTNKLNDMIQSLYNNLDVRRYLI